MRARCAGAPVVEHEPAVHRQGFHVRDSSTWCVDEAAVVSRARASLELGEALPIVGASGTVWGAALRATSESNFRPTYVSAGPGVSLATAIRLAVACRRYRVPEPVRLAELEGWCGVRNAIVEACFDPLPWRWPSGGVRQREHLGVWFLYTWWGESAVNAACPGGAPQGRLRQQALISMPLLDALSQRQIHAPLPDVLARRTFAQRLRTPPPWLPRPGRRLACTLARPPMEDAIPTSRRTGPASTFIIP